MNNYGLGLLFLCTIWDKKQKMQPSKSDLEIDFHDNNQSFEAFGSALISIMPYSQDEHFKKEYLEWIWVETKFVIGVFSRATS